MPIAGNPTSIEAQPLSALEKVKGLMSMMRGNGPKDAVESVVKNDPEVRQIMDFVNAQYGGDPKAAFYAEAKRRGVDPNLILGMLR